MEQDGDDNGETPETDNGPTGGEPGGKPVTDETDDETSESPDNTSRRLSWRVLVAGAVLAVALIGGGFLLANRDEAPAPTTTTVETVQRSTTTTTRKLPADTFEVATVKSTMQQVPVLAAAPPEWQTSEHTVVPTSSVNPPPTSQDDAPDHPPIPTDAEPVVGRYVAEGGWEFSNPGPYEPPQPTTFLVTERRGEWVEVLLPVRPNGTKGYISTANVDLSTTRQRIEVRVGEHRLVAYDGDTVIAESAIVAGLSNSPTPTGTFYVTDVVPYKNPSGFYGPYALATNGYSEWLNEFDDGAPVLAIHGTNRPDLLGQDRSNGCIRLPNDVIDKIAKSIDLGAPIFIWP